MFVGKLGRDLNKQLSGTLNKADMVLGESLLRIKFETADLLVSNLKPKRVPVLLNKIAWKKSKNHKTNRWHFFGTAVSSWMTCKVFSNVIFNKTFIFWKSSFFQIISNIPFSDSFDLHDRNILFVFYADMNKIVL